ncbi:hypothetical protein D3C87_704110 [compost metagenome]|uniref:PLD nuclease N-terminal domain-containing protein n=1 Tax=Pedobacter ghigonis TaxID=2730403 RepID=UPI000FB4BD01|nr:PLD nuclease N-terminal domain-containing protein [Pedobacter ghigonis]
MELTDLFLVFIAFLLPIGALLDLMKDQSTKGTKVIWSLMIIFIPLIGPLTYLVYSRYIFLFAKNTHLVDKDK